MQTKEKRRQKSSKCDTLTIMVKENAKKAVQDKSSISTAAREHDMLDILVQ